MAKRLEEAHVVGVGVDDVDVVGVLRLDHQLGVVAETLDASSLSLQSKIKHTMTPGSRQVILGSRFRPFLISSLPRLAGNHNDDDDDGDDDDDDDDVMVMMVMADGQ